jgi:TRAP-type C4-dicarboxylate transport system permease large subunit
MGPQRTLRRLHDGLIPGVVANLVVFIIVAVATRNGIPAVEGRTRRARRTRMIVHLLYYGVPSLVIAVTLWVGFLGWRFYVREVLRDTANGTEPTVHRRRR